MSIIPVPTGNYGPATGSSGSQCRENTLLLGMVEKCDGWVHDDKLELVVQASARKIMATEDRGPPSLIEVHDHGTTPPTPLSTGLPPTAAARRLHIGAPSPATFSRAYTQCNIYDDSTYPLTVRAHTSHRNSHLSS